MEKVGFTRLFLKCRKNKYNYNKFNFDYQKPKKERVVL